MLSLAQRPPPFSVHVHLHKEVIIICLGLSNADIYADEMEKETEKEKEVCNSLINAFESYEYASITTIRQHLGLAAILCFPLIIFEQ